MQGPAAARAVGGGQGGAALLRVPRDVPVLAGAADAHLGRYSVDIEYSVDTISTQIQPLTV